MDSNEKKATTIHRVVHAMAASLQGLDMLPPEDRSASQALSLFEHALSRLQLTPAPGEGPALLERTLVALLRAKTEGPSMRTEGPSPHEILH